MQSNFDKAAYKYLLSLTIFMVLLGIIVYHLVEKFSWVDAYYFSVITLATVGYGDLTPHTAFGKILELTLQAKLQAPLWLLLSTQYSVCICQAIK
jgi:hypothetical protein